MAGPQQEHVRTVTPLQNVVVWVVLLALTGANILFALAHLGKAAIPVTLGVAFVQAFIGATFYMHLIEKRSALRLVLPIAFIFVGLLMCATSLEVLTRYPPSVPPNPVGPYPAGRPENVRTDVGRGNAPPHRALGY